MKNRTDKVWAALAPLIEQRRQQDRQEALAATETAMAELLKELQTALRSCNEQALIRQREDAKGPTAYITLSFLDSSILTGADDIRIDFYDDGFLGDVNEACAYFSYRHMVAPYRESAAVLCQAAAKQFVRFMDYEKDALTWKYKDEVFYQLVMFACALCLSHPEMTDFWPELDLAEHCVITFGRFLHKQRLYLQFTPAGGVTAP